MKILVGTNGSGKTRELVAEAAANNGTIVCKDVNKMVDKIHAYGYTGVKVISFDEFISYSNAVGALSDEKFYIRHVEELLKKMNICGFTLTID